MLINQLFQNEGTYEEMERKERGRENGKRWRGKAAEIRDDLVFPFLLDVEVPLPGQVVMLVVVSKLGLYIVGATGQHALRSLL